MIMNSFCTMCGLPRLAQAARVVKAARCGFMSFVLYKQMFEHPEPVKYR
jgi:hypothetical protein